MRAITAQSEEVVRAITARCEEVVRAITVQCKGKGKGEVPCI